MIKKAIIAIVIALLLTVGLLVAIIALQPENFAVERKASMAAPPEKIFAEINDFHKWDQWSPWSKLDPNMKVTYSGPDSGPGASYAWTGNDEVGEGKMTIAESQPPEHIKVAVDFIKPFAASNMIDFSIKPTPAGSDVTWTMSGKNNFVAKAASLFIDMDKAIGGDFEKGLSQLKTVVESPEKQP